MSDYSGMRERMIAAAPEMYALLRVWVNIRAEPVLMEAKLRARELIAQIDGENADESEE